MIRTSIIVTDIQVACKNSVVTYKRTESSRKLFVCKNYYFPPVPLREISAVPSLLKVGFVV